MGVDPAYPKPPEPAILNELQDLGFPRGFSKR